MDRGDGTNLEGNSDDDDDADVVVVWDLDEVVPEILGSAGLPDEASPAMTACLVDLGLSYPDGWLVIWWMPIAWDVETIAFTGNTMPAAKGWNCVYVADRDNLLEMVIDAADQATSCTVIDLEESF